jgi:hypothetical protein
MLKSNFALMSFILILYPGEMASHKYKEGWFEVVDSLGAFLPPNS